LTLGGDVRFSYPVADYADFVVGYRHELERKLSESLWQPVDALTLALQEDSTDDPLFPTRGVRRSISMEKAGGFAVGKEYTKLDATWTWFVPLYDIVLPPPMARALAVRLKVGMGDERLSGLQLYELGGPTTVRGFDGDTVKRMALANFEHRLKLADGFVLTTFLDAGLDLDSLRLDAVKASTGLELGISAAGVYVRLDVVWSLSDDASWVPKFDFGFGPMF
jgi:outer membrane protein assembly factor BamA